MFFERASFNVFVRVFLSVEVVGSEAMMCLKLDDVLCQNSAGVEDFP